MKKTNMKNTVLWFLTCNIALVISAFIHECAHGFSSWLAGYSVSTGFNRVGNAYSYPGDDNFRIDWAGGEVLADIGPAVTLLLAIIFTVIFLCKKYHNSFLDQSILAMALGNAIIRLVPCVTVILRIAFTGGGVEDEVQQGEALAQHFGVPLLNCLPLVISIAVSLVCLFLIYRKFLSFRRNNRLMANPSWVWPAYISSFGILDVLDNLIRLNWVA